MKRIQSLDGLRAISILMVLLAHAAETMPVPLSNYKFLFENAGIGVSIFFVISGYLITKLLIIEQNKNGTVSLKDFYLRRAFRIFPIFYLYILVVVILKNTILISIFTNYGLLYAAMLYVWNYMHLFIKGSGIPDNGYWFFGHFWSLSMEEQFYLLWPIAFIKIDRRSLIKIVSIIVLLMPFMRIATYFFMPGSRGQIGMMLQTGGDTILVGCLGALIEDSDLFKEKFLTYLSKNMVLIAVVIYLFILSPIVSKNVRGFDIVIGASLTSIFIMVLVFCVTKFPSKLSYLLNTKVLVQIGVLSYSLYIWQQLFLTPRNTFWVNKFPQNILVVFAVGFFSYYIIEKPILNLKKRFKKVP